MDYKEIPIFIINLKKDKQKKENMQKYCEKNKLTPIFTEAIYGDELSEDTISQVYSKDLALKYFGRELTKGEIGTALSHLEIYRQIIDQNIQEALILEDDVDFKINHQDLIDIVTKLPNDWECIMLGHHTKRSRDIDTLASFWNKIQINDKLKCVRFAEQPFGGYGYIINKDGVLKRLNDFKIIDRPIDHWDDKKLNLYGAYPSIIKINEYFSDYSSLDLERSKMDETTIRTSFERFKDRIQLLLRTLHLFEAFFILKSFFIQFKILNKYKSH
ncbi:glycosyltransferase family 25 protein [Sulfurovum sp. XTW-4]|uniref:Glycosyltransferase family 25 protein n=1 Tax=Sulfurovum xiamenensis TaxID=3019066 RepID=A0ABT7QSE0_9BACT|nr:glycosyltransferase family 25 protein [Sulfurovum xiamenensis]MDM5263707.1 glycosyltransferase family 25 protein [Sulfurovum xiamenensis]